MDPAILIVITYVWSWLSVWTATLAVLSGTQEATPITLRLALTTLATTALYPIFPPLYLASILRAPRSATAPPSPAPARTNHTVTQSPTPGPGVAVIAQPPVPTAWDEEIPAYLRRCG
ncbi:hypothetical protein [Azospirillum canadense]|uniref:hypothetical protein n=1 Tax=Azospirillum canadense TaxID=403962 RepID=UPI002226F050|nr:hypothetical protein [Azospirillum canadense]MCW2240722.1 hypothetical protein [Azospirillum canadense]